MPPDVIVNKRMDAQEVVAKSHEIMDVLGTFFGTHLKPEDQSKILKEWWKEIGQPSSLGEN